MPPLRRPLTYRARALRRAMTAAERLLWALLRGRRLGHKFRRQQPLGPFVVDFFCFEAALVVEVDGPVHRRRKRRDRFRDAWLGACGLRVLHLTNDQVLHHTDQALATIRNLLPPASQPPPPLPAGEGAGG